MKFLPEIYRAMNLFTENVDFYPTPEDVINTMMLGEDILGKTILEPSAGSGNIVRWLKSNGAGEVIACETLYMIKVYATENGTNGLSFVLKPLKRVQCILNSLTKMYGCALIKSLPHREDGCYQRKVEKVSNTFKIYV